MDQHKSGTEIPGETICDPRSLPRVVRVVDPANDASRHQRVSTNRLTAKSSHRDPPR